MKLCEFCKKETDKPKFCSQSCAAKLNNKLYPKRTPGPKRFCPECKGMKSKSAQRCHNCAFKGKLLIKGEGLYLTQNEVDNLSLNVLIYGYNGNNAPGRYSRIRWYAQRTINNSGLPKCCKVCGWDVLVEVCHIKAIKDFPKEATLAVVNSLDNLVYLCPNHHAMFDRGLIQL